MANRVSNYIKESIEELKKVSWPTAAQTRNYTVLVIGVSLAVALFLGTLDFAFTWGLEKLIGRGV